MLYDLRHLASLNKPKTRKYSSSERKEGVIEFLRNPLLKIVLAFTQDG
jgi:hypothetical protein